MLTPHYMPHYCLFRATLGRSVLPSCLQQGLQQGLLPSNMQWAVNHLRHCTPCHRTPRPHLATILLHLSTWGKNTASKILQKVLIFVGACKQVLIPHSWCWLSFYIYCSTFFPAAAWTLNTWTKLLELITHLRQEWPWICRPITTPACPLHPIPWLLPLSRLLSRSSRQRITSSLCCKAPAEFSPRDRRQDVSLSQQCVSCSLRFWNIDSDFFLHAWSS